MPRLRVHNFSISLDGYGAGPDQSLADPLGVGGLDLHQWLLPTRTFGRLVGDAALAAAGETGIDDDFVAGGIDGIGATIMGRNMFGPIRGDWPDERWTGWWGDDPPFHHPVFILTHYPRRSVTMEGGTTFHFVTDGIRAALDRAFEAAGGQDVRLGGGVSTIQQYLRAGLIDHLHIAIVPILLGCGERLLDGLAEIAPRYTATFTPSRTVVHAVIIRADQARSA
jgi:dihydrofolate reductase